MPPYARGDAAAVPPMESLTGCWRVVLLDADRRATGYSDREFTAPRWRRLALGVAR